jgi:L-rhamnose-H+ transport protein
MTPVAPHPILGVSFHAVGATFAANCYAPQKYIQRWSWEIYWMTQAVWCWLLWPIVGAIVTIPSLWQVLT